MPLQLNGQNIEVPAGDSGTYTWANVIALNSTNMITVTNTNGRTLYRWRGVLTLRGTATLTISRQLIELMRVSTTQRGQLVVQDSAKINFDYCTITAREFYQQFTGGDNGGQRYLLRIEGNLAEINAYETSFDLGDVSTFNTKVGVNIRTEIALSNIRNCSVQGSVPASIPAGYDGYSLRKVSGSIKNLQLRNTTLEIAFTNDTNVFENITNYGGLYALTNWGYNGLNLRNFVVDGNPTSDYFSNTLIFTTFIDCIVNLANGAVMKQDLILAAGEHKKAATHNIKIEDIDGGVVNVLVSYAGRSNLNATTDASGNLPEFVLIHQETNLQAQPDPGGSFALYPKPLPVIDFSSYTRTIKSYKHLSLVEVLTVGAKIGSTTNPFQIRLALDPGVTELNTTTVGAYSGISHTVAGFTVSGTRSIAETYDSRKLFWRNNNGVVVPVRDGQVASFGLTDITLSGPAVVTPNSKFPDGLATTGVVTLQAPGVYSLPVFASNQVFVAAGETDLSSWTFDSVILNTSSSSNSVVTVSIDQIGNVAVATPTVGGGTITVQTPQQTLRIYGLPDDVSTIAMVENLATDEIVYPPITAGETTIIVQDDTNYLIRADTAGYPASRFITINSGTTAELEIQLTEILDADGNPLIAQGNPDVAALLEFDPATLTVFVEYSATYPEIDFASAVLALETQLATELGIQFTAHPYPVVLRDRNILRFPRDYISNALNPVRIKPKPTNTGNPTFLFEVEHEGSPSTPYSLFDFSEADGKVINYPAVLAVAQTQNTFTPVDIAGAVWTAENRTLTTLEGLLNAIAQQAALDTLLGRLTDARAAKLDRDLAERADVAVTVDGGFTTGDRTKLNSIPSDPLLAANYTEPPTPETIAAELNPKLQLIEDQATIAARNTQS